ncbi:sigma-70 family RNA polymerase sigma factor [Fulvivirga sp. M361]|uniref:RNA polymerase sigma factor n=1 Tax=Fulvivirga sp. M361 TaxID=2594266 RepID=UPI00117B5342|nr:sigma-70 family RNA polymerase sigma factor [Fulvivirga sp. M361]TRX56199.1 sigma-70 family RNA polymerase sigma factor [Fulvivirga sp. M361]
MDRNAEINDIVEHFFRHESGKMVAVLTGIFGPENMQLAEDVVQEAIIEAIQNWTNKDIPKNPTAWLYRVAKNKALNVVNRNKRQQQFNPDTTHFLQSPWTAEPAMDLLFSEQEILDDQLRMMFVCCHPSISPDSQIALILRTLCGFSIAEIGRAFLTAPKNINTRLVRARKKVRDAKIPFTLPAPTHLSLRLQVVLEAIYLLFNEGYNATDGPVLIRKDLCEEAIRITELLIAHPLFEHKTRIYALLALMQLNAARFNARQDDDGKILTLEKQDRQQWDHSLIQKGLINLEKSADDQITLYHILASISAYHCTAKSFATTNWKGILKSYDILLQSDNSPVIILNRAIALSKVEGAQTALAELGKIANEPVMESYYLYYSVLAELHLQLEQLPQASKALKKAVALTTLPAEKELLRAQLDRCQKK